MPNYVIILFILVFIFALVRKHKQALSENIKSDVIWNRLFGTPAKMQRTASYAATLVFFVVLAVYLINYKPLGINNVGIFIVLLCVIGIGSAGVAITMKDKRNRSARRITALFLILTTIVFVNSCMQDTHKNKSEPEKLSQKDVESDSDTTEFEVKNIRYEKKPMVEEANLVPKSDLPNKIQIYRKIKLYHNVGFEVNPLIPARKWVLVDFPIAKEADRLIWNINCSSDTWYASCKDHDCDMPNSDLKVWHHDKTNKWWKSRGPVRSLLFYGGRNGVKVKIRSLGKKHPS